ncbi:hypothetical protein SAMN04488522_105481 [Pedobacter caeni]|uniref:Uncharacterized protein n=1 Tax=Pedobacter caeni TaxID=288992 RepID=A0A1M5JRY8_9SPHI|nr:hypothetical protein SAMN04488522_105481 [Pedobacter caeni]
MNLITYCYWGEGFNDLVIEINNEKFPVQYTEENDVKRNQLFVYIDIAVNEEYLPISFGKEISRKIIDLDKKITDLKIVHPKVNTFKSIFKDEAVVVNRVEIIRFAEKARYGIENRTDEEPYLSTHIFIRTDNPSKNILIYPTYTSFRFYDEMGFFILQKDSLKEYVKKNKLADNLLLELENGDKADDLPIKGILSIFWGFRPWYYKIIVTEKLDYQLPVGKKVYETGQFRFSEISSIYDIIPGGIFESLNNSLDHSISQFKNGEHQGYLTTFYVAGGRSGLREFEGLHVYIHIELLKKVDEVIEYNQIDPLDEFNNLFEDDLIGDGVSTKI